MSERFRPKTWCTRALVRRALARGLLSRELAHSSKWCCLSQGLELSVAEDEALAELLLQLGEMRPHGREAARSRAETPNVFLILSEFEDVDVDLDFAVPLICAEKSL